MDTLQLPPDWHLKPNVARIYDYWLGGYHNFPADRAAADHLESIAPDTAVRVKANRQFLQRVVKVLAEQGIDQFLDLGSGLPSVGNIHETVRDIHPRTRVVYVDSDPIAVAHSQNLLRADTSGPDVVAMQGDIRFPEPILAKAQQVLDFSRPVAMLCFAVLHFVVDDDEASRCIAQYRSACVAGSYLALSHVTHEQLQTEADEFTSYYKKNVSDLHTRTSAELMTFFDTWELLPPGLVPIPLWRPDEQTLLADRPGYSGILGGVARKTA